MEFNQLLKEKTVTHKEELSELKFLEILKEKCKNSHKIVIQVPIFMNTDGETYMLVKPAEKEKRSGFWLDQLIKSFPSWSRYPNRTRCIRGYTTAAQAGGDDPYAVIPFDTARVGICPDTSFFRSFKHVEKDFDLKKLDNNGLQSWVTHVSQGLEKLGEVELNIDAPNLRLFSHFRGALNKIDKVIQQKRAELKTMFKKKRDDLEDEEVTMLSDMLNRHITNIDQYLEEKLEPEANGFSCIKIESFHNADGEHEVWTDSPCLLIRRSRYIELHKKGVIK